MDIISFAKSLYHRPAENVPFVSAIVVAAGKSTRMGSGKSKQLTPLCGIATIARTLSVFEASRYIKEVIVVTSLFDIRKVGEIVREFGFEKVTKIVIGGETRQQSAAFGLKAVNKDAEYVAVHDGARPLVSAACVDRVAQTAIKTGAAAVAVRVKDTLKIADDNGVVLSTPNREQYWAVQTPQIFKAELYRNAFEKATQDHLDYSDDCQLIEAAGGKVQLVEGEYTNIKITTSSDVSQAEAIIRARGEAF